MSLSSPRERYRQALAQGLLAPDTCQRQVVEHLQRLYAALTHPRARRRGAGILRRLGLLRHDLRGLYLWGGVGRGKTLLMDMLYASLPFPEKRRLHFHRFMYWVHERRRRLGNVRSPLRLLAAEFAGRSRVLFFDEFHVSDIADAMLLGGLLEALFERGVALVATSNDRPDRLYRDGLQRQRFLPAIRLLQRHTEVVCLQGATDYRLQFLDRAGVYYHPLDAAARRNLERDFARIALGHGDAGEAVILIAGREIRAVRCFEGIVWFSFAEICGGPRAPADYIEIARLYRTVLVSEIPRLQAPDDDRARRFIALVDEFYDRNVKLIVSAAAAPERRYAGRRHARIFSRTASRLREMGSRSYLARPHRP